MMEGKVISLGSVNVDFQVRAERWPEAGETLLAHDYLMVGGGKGANVAYIARRLGTAAGVLARVGDDSLAEEALRPLRKIGADLGAIRRVKGRATGTAFITVRPDGEKTIILAANANQVWTSADAAAIEKTVAEAPNRSVLVADLEVPAEIVRKALNAAKRQGFRTILDPSPADRVDAALFPLIDYVTPNPVEARRLTGIAVDSTDAAFHAGQRLLELGAGAALVKLGAEGCVLVSKETRAHFPAPPMQAIDTTGAGDAFAGAFAVALLLNRIPRDAARFAVTAASLAVTRYGSQAAYPTLDEVERLMATSGEQAG